MVRFELSILRKAMYSNKQFHKAISIGLIAFITTMMFSCEPTPTAVPTVNIYTGRNNTYFINNAGEVRICGDNYYGQLGNGGSNDAASPELITNVGNIQKIKGGSIHTLILKSDGTVWSIGNNSVGQLGIGSTTDVNLPAEITSLSSVIEISAGDYHSLFLINDGSVWSCGGNTTGQLGDGSTTNRQLPVPITGLNNIVDIKGGFGHSLFLKSDGTVWACGFNIGQLGDGTTTNRNTPVQVNGLSGIINIAAGETHSLFLKNDGTVWGCGDNLYGTLGNGITTNNKDSFAFQIAGLNNIVDIAAGLNYSIFLKDDGTVYACGSNNYGQLGMGSSGNYFSTPTLIPGIDHVVAVAAGDYHSVFLKDDGSVWVCGNNTEGQLGIGSTFDVDVPTQVTGL